MMLNPSDTLPRGLWAAVAAAACIATSTPSPAAIIVGQSATSSSSIAPPFDRGTARAVDGSGLSAGDGSLATPDVFHTNAPEASMWLSSGVGFGGQDPDPTYTVDLNGTYDVSGVRIWNYNENSGNPAAFTLRGVNQTNILISLDGSAFTNLGAFPIPVADGTNTYAGTFFDILALNGGTPLRFRYMQFDIQSSHGGDSGFYGLSEVQFEGQIIPEPASLALLGLSATILAARRRRRCL